MRTKIVRGLLAVLVVVAVLLIQVVLAVRRDTGPSPDCRSPADGPVQPGTTTARTLTSGGLERCYLLHVPPGYDPAQPAPVVVTLHGMASNGNAIQQITDWNEVADAENFVVVYPDGLLPPLRWNTDRRLNLGGVDDVQFFRDIVADVAAMVSVDTARVYVNGFSNGGGMSILIACQAADAVAAVGAVEMGTLSVETLNGCASSRPVPAIQFQGTGDPGLLKRDQEVTPVLGWLLNLSTEPFEAPSSKEWAEIWAERNRCGMTPETIPPRGDASGIRYTNCQDDADVVLYTIEGMGHQWPGANPIPLLGESTQDINATEEMWAFFKTRTMETSP